MFSTNSLQRYHSIKGSGGNKLRTYRLFKHVFELEPYLSNVRSTALRVALTQLQIGSHSLAIEVGRYHWPSPLPVEERLQNHRG